MNTWTVAQGVDAVYQVTICDEEGVPIKTYIGTEPLTGIVWPGGDAAQTFALAVTWDDPTQGTILASIAAADTQALGEGNYRVQIMLVDAGGKNRDVYEGELQVYHSPLAVSTTTQTGTVRVNTYDLTGLSSTAGLAWGYQVDCPGVLTSGTIIAALAGPHAVTLSLLALTSTTATFTFTAAEPPVYCTYEDMLLLAPWIGDLQALLQDETGFSHQRALARRKMDKIILTNYRGHTVGNFGMHSAMAFNWAHGGGKRRSVVTSPIIRQWLAAGDLMLRDDILRINAHWAIADICLAQMGRGGRYTSYGSWHRREGDKLAAGTTAELDINQDGFAEIGVPLGVTNTLFT